MADSGKAPAKKVGGVRVPDHAPRPRATSSEKETVDAIEGAGTTTTLANPASVTLDVNPVREIEQKEALKPANQPPKEKVLYPKGRPTVEVDVSRVKENRKNANYQNYCQRGTTY
eukprot:CAMPEP_0174258116 /NCGR_PEP_ID=MMETSP0439-20130205/7172_1 /TAXON_ID=0 /ORGANISM="Stereomyxa ramosa, Strain Chinc5" /LENGTH=114 /DNA_ID=CAMNT_0015341499 /DNA_START=18 /DNA_END=362 /DNA_ORIENTATION=-